MKTFVHLRSLVLALGAAGLLAGCVSSHHYATRQVRPAKDFEVVETSAKRMLTEKEMADLKAAVAKFLEGQGAVSSGSYYVKVYLEPEKEGAASDWVIVRFTRDSDLRFELLGSEDSYYPGYRPYASYDYYPYGYDNFSRISFQYYDDPYYGPGYYFPPPHRHRDRDGDGNHGHGRGRDHDRDGDDHNHQAGTQNPPRFKPIPAVGSNPPVITRTRWDEDAGGSNPNNDTPRQHHGPRNGFQAGNQPVTQPYVPSVPPAAQAAPTPAAPPAMRPPEQRRDHGTGPSTRSDFHRGNSNRTERSDPPRSEAPARNNYTPPSSPPPAPARSDSSQNNNSDNSSRDSGRSFKPSYRQ